MELSWVRFLISSKTGFGQRAFDGHGLHQAGAVAEQRKDDLAGFPQVIEPTGNLHGLAFVPVRLGNRDPLGRLLEHGKELTFRIAANAP